MSPGSSTESYPAFARIGLRENPEKTSTRSNSTDWCVSGSHNATLARQSSSQSKAAAKRSGRATNALYLSTYVVPQPQIFITIMSKRGKSMPATPPRKRKACCESGDNFPYWRSVLSALTERKHNKERIMLTKTAIITGIAKLLGQEDRDITYALFCSVLCIMEQVLFDEILILSVEENPHFYDKRRASYKDEKMKENTWRSIAASLNTDRDNTGEMSPGSSTESYPAFARTWLRENPGKNLNQATSPDRDSNPDHLVSRPDALTVTPQEHVESMSAGMLNLSNCRFRSRFIVDQPLRVSSPYKIQRISLLRNRET
ncbi:hypothetical protein ANN_25262 [Periplaneta americana]|uniref:MADF domain-containing protein n=1 Tax=Periplaneta americana TaxID=6978 RepID=A0ABQ8S0V2_PERAM|nr:hypothetical protein ANN_25262 [Periplaneta americana]